MIAFQVLIHLLSPEPNHLIPFIEPYPVPLFTTQPFLASFALNASPASRPHLPYPPYELLPIGCLHARPPPSADLPRHLHRPLMHLALALHGPHGFPHHVL